MRITICTMLGIGIAALAGADDKSASTQPAPPPPLTASPKTIASAAALLGVNIHTDTPQRRDLLKRGRMLARLLAPHRSNATEHRLLELGILATLAERVDKHYAKGEHSRWKCSVSTSTHTYTDEVTLRNQPHPDTLPFGSPVSRGEAELQIDRDTVDLRLLPPDTDQVWRFHLVGDTVHESFGDRSTEFARDNFSPAFGRDVARYASCGEIEFLVAPFVPFEGPLAINDLGYGSNWAHRIRGTIGAEWKRPDPKPHFRTLLRAVTEWHGQPALTVEYHFLINPNFFDRITVLPDGRIVAHQASDISQNWLGQYITTRIDWERLPQPVPSAAHPSPINAKTATGE